MDRELRSIIANVNLFYKRICSAYAGQFPEYTERALNCIPEELYIKILIKSCPEAFKRFGIEEIQKAVRRYQKRTEHKDTYYEELFPDSERQYISVLETSTRAAAVYTDYYLLSGFLLTHGKRFFERYWTGVPKYARILYFVMFGTKPEEMEKMSFCLKEICEENKKKLEIDEISCELKILLDEVFKHANELMLTDQFWQKNRLKQEPQILEECIEDIVSRYYKSQGKIPLQEFQKSKDE